MTEPERLYTVKEAADVLRCSTRTVYREVDADRIAAKRTRGKILITATALQAFIDSLDPPERAAL